MLRQIQTSSLQPLTTAHIATTMSLLELNSIELGQKIEAELGSNPALELVDQPRCPSCNRALLTPGLCPLCNLPQHLSEDQPIVFISPSSDFASHQRPDLDQDLPIEELTAAEEDLPTYVLRQIAPELEPAERPLAAHILTSLDEDGLLRVPVVEIARYHHVLPSKVERIIHLIQRAEPFGVGSPSPQAALLVQLEILAESQPVPPLASRAISQGMDLLSRHAYVELGKLLGVDAEEARQITAFIINNLNPYPGRTFWGDIHYNAEPLVNYQRPDIIITRLNSEPDSPLIVEIVSPFAGSLRINPLFRQSFAAAPADKAEQWFSDLERATLLVKCLQQRNQALVRLMHRLVVLQRQFILEGDAYLLPVTRAEMAKELKVHESTVSRAVAGKSVQLPNQRIILLDKLFDRSLHIRAALKQIVAQEEYPLSDGQIAKLLEKQGYSIARRTVAKYRSIEGILSARLRGVKIKPAQVQLNHL